MIINCRVLVNHVEELEESENLARLLDKPVFPECHWEYRSLDITTATALRELVIPGKEPDSCREAHGCASIMWGEYDVATDIPYEQLAIWWKLKRSEIEMDYDEEKKSLFILF